MQFNNSQLIAMAVDITKAAMLPVGGNSAQLLENPEKTVNYLQAVYEKLAELNCPNKAGN